MAGRSDCAECGQVRNSLNDLVCEVHHCAFEPQLGPTGQYVYGIPVGTQSVSQKVHCDIVARLEQCT